MNNFAAFKPLGKLTMKIHYLLTIFLLSFFIKTFAQMPNVDRKRMKTTRVENAPIIDGELNDDAWKNVQIANDFYVLRPNNGQKAPETHKTEVRVVYDDEAIYISAKMLAPDPQKIPRQFTYRDNFGQADFFLVTINPIDDGQNPFEFVVMSSGSQAEAKVSAGREDFSWNAVWESDVKITNTGWNVEMKIPYRALRFANLPVQSWGFNFHRNVLNNNAQYTWNLIDNTQGIWTQYDGLIEDFRNIEPPVRLAFYPYTSGTYNNFEEESDFNGSVGMDIKYGLTENITLDATLIPDFGQTGFDNVSLNLGPFEQVFSEQRQFFTEGTELFSKGGLFFSRRIGNRPTEAGKVEDELEDNEEIIDNPSSVKMLNAIKISGRTKKGLGIGFFNAITEKTEATILDTITGISRKRTTESFANYNVLVLDQNFNKNSSVTLINTNVTRDGAFRDGNVTGLLYHVRTKDSRFFVDGSIKMSNVKERYTKDSNSYTISYDSITTGYSFDTSIAKAAGNWRYELGYQFDDEKYDINDMGVLFRNNRQSVYGNISYRILQPKGKYNNWDINTWFNLNYLKKPGYYTGNQVGVSTWFNTRERFSFGGNINGNIGNQYDYFEPRKDISKRRFFTQPSKISINGWVSSDYRKRFAYDANFGFYKSPSYLNHSREGIALGLSPRFRFNDKFLVTYGFNYQKRYNEQGWVADSDDDIVFGQRDVKTFENNISAQYNFTVSSSLSLSFRHNWSDVAYENTFLNLQEDGSLNPNADYSDVHDLNFNSWNLDINYVWQFAPGSQLIAFYRNSILNKDENTGQQFFSNLNNLFKNPIQNIFSLRLVYFIDYNNAKNIL